MTLKACTGHDDVVVVYDSDGYERRPCPLCAQREDNQQLDSRVDELEDKVIDLRSRVHELESELSDAQREAQNLRDSQ